MDTRQSSNTQREFFETHIRPRLAEHCYDCHAADAESIQAGLTVDSRGGLLRGGDSGPAMVPGDPDASLLIAAIRYQSYEMPPSGKLADRDVEVFERWIREGAYWPDELAPAASVAPRFDLAERRDQHWAWQPVVAAGPPAVSRTDWPITALDHFVLAKLEQRGLTPSPDTDRAALLRRLHFDLTGLPPTAAEVRSFVADDSEEAVRLAVDSLLASPHFGERWGRHWLDLVRYAESRGHEFDDDIPNAFQYRDYVIRAFNADVPYDQFVLEHLAGDLIEQPRLNPVEGFNESVLGTGFWFLGEWVHSPVDTLKDEADRMDNMIDVMSKTFLGLTVACARCHDHKFDAISTADYYSLTGFLQSSDYRQVRFESMPINRSIAMELAACDSKYRSMLADRIEATGLTPPSSLNPTETLALTDEFSVIDYANMDIKDWLQDGFLFGPRPRRAGEVFIDDATQTARIATHGSAVSDSFWHGLESVTAGKTQVKDRLAKIPRSGRTLRTPTFDLHQGALSCRVAGRGHVVACVDSHRLVHGPLHGQTIRQIDTADDWVTLDLSRYVGHRLHLEFTPDRGESLAVRMVVEGLSPDALSDLDHRLAAADAEFARYAEEASSIIDQSCREVVARWVDERNRLRTRVAHRSRVAPAMMDGTGEDARVFIRGNSSRPGKVEPRHFLTVIAGENRLPIAAGSGRLQLADAINDPANPLSSRVIVNRLWHHLIGRGIVATPDDFGVLGRRPTHPELLDHLASEFVAEGRSLKRMIRRIVLSRTYRMSTKVDPRARQVDPDNRWLHHRPPRRLEGEAIRDAMLFVSGRFDSKMFGPSVPVHLTPFMDGRGRPATSGPLDGDGRRTIYIATRRNFLSPFLSAFDTPAPFSTMGRRNVSNVPAQALILLNDPFVRDQAGAWARRAGQEQDSMTDRIEWMYLTAFARSPSAAELATAIGFLGDGTDHSLWRDFAHVLLNTKEFIYLR